MARDGLQRILETVPGLGILANNPTLSLLLNLLSRLLTASIREDEELDCVEKIADLRREIFYISKELSIIEDDRESGEADTHNLMRVYLERLERAEDAILIMRLLEDICNLLAIARKNNDRVLRTHAEQLLKELENGDEKRIAEILALIKQDLERLEDRRSFRRNILEHISP
jgi:hypothetical protein